MAPRRCAISTCCSSSARFCGKSRGLKILNAQLNGDVLAETIGLQSWCTVQSRKPFVEALSGLLIGLESQVPRIYSKTTPPLLEKYGFSEEEVTFFTIHIAADVEHGEKGLRDRREVRHHRRGARRLRAQRARGDDDAPAPISTACGAPSSRNPADQKLAA